MGYVVSFITYQAGTFITTGSLGTGFAAGLVVVVLLISYIGYLMKKGNKLSEEKLAMAI